MSNTRALAIPVASSIDVRLVWAFLATYLGLMPVGWSPFPANIQLSELVFVALIALAIGQGLAARGRTNEVYTCQGIVPVRKLFSLRLVDVGVVVYFFGLFPSFVATPNLARSALGLSKHTYGVALYAVLIGMLPTNALLTRSVIWLGITAGAWAIAALAAAFLYQVTGIELGWLGFTNQLPYVGTVFRVSGPFISADYFGEFLTFGFPLAIYASRAATTDRWRSAARASVVAIALAGVLTFSRSIAGLLIGGLFAVWPEWSTGPRRALKAAGAVAAFALLLVVTVASAFVIRQVELEHLSRAEAGKPYWQALQRDPTQTPALALTVSYNPVSYYLLKRAALDAFLQHPFTGVGLNMFHEVTRRAALEGRLQPGYREADPHSTFLGSLAETGLPGGVTLAFLWVVLLLSGARASRPQSHSAVTQVARAAMAGVLGLLVNSPNVDVMNFRFLWVGIAMVRTCSLKRRMES